MSGFLGNSNFSTVKLVKSKYYFNDNYDLPKNNFEYISKWKVKFIWFLIFHGLELLGISKLEAKIIEGI